ncbi:5839_t:CDS:2 [Acaulospora morrowiae]|uniref:5839_t:CDS:1 n=1 Tax=Acaulospora morrowiae TaxID=94023 RepID=A0A9N9CLA6_9GLOM|nr:5839_t:CDS:2 [Acaulospora morrowiae]
MTTEISEEYVKAVIENSQSIYSLRTPEDMHLIMKMVNSLLISSSRKLKDVDIFLNEYDSVWKEYNQESNHLEGWDYHHADHEEYIQSDVERLPMIEESPFELKTYDAQSDARRLPMKEESPFELKTYDDLYEMDDWCDVCDNWVEEEHVHTFCSKCVQIVKFHKNGVHINECICDFVPVIDYFNSGEELRQFFLINNAQGLCIFCENSCSEELCVCEFTCGLKYVMGYDKYGKVVYGTCGWYSDNLKHVKHDCQGGVHRLNDVTMGSDKRKDVSSSNFDSELESKRLKVNEEQSVELKPNSSGSKRKQPDFQGEKESESSRSKRKQLNFQLSQKQKNLDMLDKETNNRILSLGDDNMKNFLNCEKSYQLSNLVNGIAFDIIKTESDDWEEKMSVLQLYNKIRREIYSVIERNILDKTLDICTWLVTVCQGPAKGMMYEDFRLQKWLSENSNVNND